MREGKGYDSRQWLCTVHVSMEIEWFLDEVTVRFIVTGILNIYIYI